MRLKEKYGDVALIAGASEGLGAAYAHYLAREGLNLILIARRKEPLDKLAALLIAQYKVNVQCFCCDLSNMDAVEEIEKKLQGINVNVFVYNAAVSFIGPFENNSLEQHHILCLANIKTPMLLTQVLGTKMLKQGRGAVILMSSLAGFQGSGFLAAYGASKAFNLVLAESLWYEWKDRGVDVIACCAGATSTPNFIETKPEKTSAFAPKVQTPEEVVKECFKKLGKKPSVITGRGNKIASFIMQKLVSRKTSVKIMGDTTRKMYRL
jgi:uncharacterized protein